VATITVRYENALIQALRERFPACDGLDDGREVLDVGSDPNNPDTDADTHLDGADNLEVIERDSRINDVFDDDHVLSFERPREIHLETDLSR